MAKLSASEAAMWVTTKAIQIHGGYGYSREYPGPALLPRRQDHRDLRGHLRDPAAGHRAEHPARRARSRPAPAEARASRCRETKTPVLVLTPTPEELQRDAGAEASSTTSRWPSTTWTRRSSSTATPWARRDHRHDARGSRAQGGAGEGRACPRSSCWSRSRKTARSAGSWTGAGLACTTSASRSRTSRSRCATSRGAGATFLDPVPRPGAVGLVSFMPPSMADGVLVELAQTSGYTLPRGRVRAAERGRSGHGGSGHHAAVLARRGPDILAPAWCDAHGLGPGARRPTRRPHRRPWHRPLPRRSCGAPAGTARHGLAGRRAQPRGRATRRRPPRRMRRWIPRGSGGAGRLRGRDGCRTTSGEIGRTADAGT